MKQANKCFKDDSVNSLGIRQCKMNACMLGIILVKKDGDWLKIHWSYLKNHWSNTIVCTHLNAFFMLNSNRARKNMNLGKNFTKLNIMKCCLQLTPYHRVERVKIYGSVWLSPDWNQSNATCQNSCLHLKFAWIDPDFLTHLWNAADEFYYRCQNQEINSLTRSDMGENDFRDVCNVNLTLSSRMSSACDRSKFLQLQKFYKSKFLLPYLTSAWKMHSNEYKQA